MSAQLSLCEVQYFDWKSQEGMMISGRSGLDMAIGGVFLVLEIN